MQNVMTLLRNRCIPWRSEHIRRCCPAQSVNQILMGPNPMHAKGAGQNGRFEGCEGAILFTLCALNGEQSSI
eukprot:1159041-Pelagomonas_calceolata.AAC.2